MEQNTVGRWQAGGGWQVPSDPYLMLGICSLSVLESCIKHLLAPVLMYCSETILWKQKERSRIRAVQVDNIRGLLGIRRMDRVPKARIRELCGVKKGLDEMIYEGVLRWFGHVERVERDMIAKRIYVGECAGSRSVGRLQERWIDGVLWKRGIYVRQATRMV